MSKITRNGRFHVLRDSSGKPVARSPELVPTQAWSDLMRQATGDGKTMLEIVLSIANGEDLGQPGMPMLPNVAQRLAAAQWLIEHLHGKAVPQTEVLHARATEQALSRYLAMDEVELRRIAGRDEPEDIEDAEIIEDVIEVRPHE